ncbi:hypothetical protein Tco_1347096 [Tanacetum coccineum]
MTPHHESITLNQDALDAQAAQSSFHKRSHDNQDPPNNCKGDNNKKRQKDVDEPSSRSLRQNRSPVVMVQDDTPAMQPLDQADTLIQKHSNPEWFPNKSGLSKRRTTWFDLFLKSEINKDENHILGPSTVTITKKFKELIHQLKAAVLSEAQWNSDEGDVFKPRSFKRHMSKSTKPHPCFYNNDYSYLVDLRTEEKYTTSITKHYVARYYREGIEDRIPKRWSKEVRRYHFEALNGIHHWEEDSIDFFKAGMSAVTKGNVYSNLRIKLVIRIVVKNKMGLWFSNINYNGISDVSLVLPSFRYVVLDLVSFVVFGECRHGYAEGIDYDETYASVARLEDSKPMKTPMSSDTKLTKDEECDSIDSTKYRGMIASLLYLTTSRPDIMFSVCLCARFQEDPKTSHLEAVKRIFRYIKGTTHLGL